MKFREKEGKRELRFWELMQKRGKIDESIRLRIGCKNFNNSFIAPKE